MQRGNLSRLKISDTSLQVLVQKMNEDVDVRTLPYDCPRRAADRMRENYCNGFGYDYEDTVTVLGEPNTMFTFPQTDQEIREHFTKGMKKVEKRAEYLDSTRESRIASRRKIYSEKGIHLID
ncbi:MAG TPA: hypothetical protein VJH92_06680 [Candidatus Nanoarchaeia archaeon]|nr:hypothetical protein [Candidatus Nanoarchaeia archaeon]